MSGGQSGIKRFVPITSWLPGYRRSWLRTDLLAAVTVTALLVPEGMAYAELAGMPPQVVFYAAPVALLLYAVFGSSRQLVVAVSSAVAVMSASIVGALAPAGSAEFYTYTAALALLTGLVAILAGVARLGRIAQFFSDSVLAGFISGLALVIAIKQLPKLFGLEAGHGNFWQRLYDLLANLTAAHWATLLVGVTSLLLMIVLERRFHRLPAALVTMLYGIAVATAFGLSEHGVHVIGDVPAGLVAPRLPDLGLQELLTLIPGALALTLVGFAEAIGPARDFASKHKYQIRANQELLGFGAANVGAGLFQGFAVGSSLSKSAANDAAGARSQMSGIIAAGLTVLVALFLTPLFRNLPEATLAAIVIVAVSGMVKVGSVRRFYRVQRYDFWLAIVAFLGVLTFQEVLLGLLVAVAVSVLALIYQASQPRLTVLGRQPGQLLFVDSERYPDSRPIPGLLIARLDGGLFFANAAAIRESMVALADRTDPPLSMVLLDLELSDDLDVPGADMLSELTADLESRGMTLMLIRVHDRVRQVLDRSGVTTEIGPDNFYPRVVDAVLDHLSDIYSEEDSERIGEVIHALEEVFDTLEPHASDSAKEGLAEQRQRLEQLTRELES